MLSRDTRWKARLLPAPTSIICAPGARTRGGANCKATLQIPRRFTPLGENIAGNGPPPRRPPPARRLPTDAPKPTRSCCVQRRRQRKPAEHRSR
eukprot:gene19598-biopygen8490